MDKIVSIVFIVVGAVLNVLGVEGPASGIGPPGSISTVRTLRDRRDGIPRLPAARFFTCVRASGPVRGSRFVRDLVPIEIAGLRVTLEGAFVQDEHRPGDA